jgi:hypothetical protein
MDNKRTCKSRSNCMSLAYKNFIDKEAEFYFVAAHKVIEISKEQNAIPFDIPNVELGHHGEECSFDAI